MELVKNFSTVVAMIILDEVEVLCKIAQIKSHIKKL